MGPTRALFLCSLTGIRGNVHPDGPPDRTLNPQWRPQPSLLRWLVNKKKTQLACWVQIRASRQGRVLQVRLRANRANRANCPTQHIPTESQKQKKPYLVPRGVMIVFYTCTIKGGGFRVTELPWIGALCSRAPRQFSQHNFLHPVNFLWCAELELPPGRVLHRCIPSMCYYQKLQ